MKLSFFKRARKLAVSSLLILFFLLPVFMGLQWARGIIGSTDPREVFGDSQLADFRGERYSQTYADDLKPFDEPLITVTFDDGWESVYSAGLRVLEKYGIKTTQYIMGGLFENYLYMSEAQARSMQQAGHEIGSHTMTHPNLTTLSESLVSGEIGQSQKVLSEKFGQVRDFATPLSAYNDMVIKHARQHYRSHRATSDLNTPSDSDINLRGGFDIYNIKAYTILNTTKAADIERLIDLTIQNKGWLIIVYHQIDNSGSKYAVTPKVLDEHMKAISNSGLAVAVMGDVLDAIEANNKRGRQ